ncbi:MULTISPECIES: DUF2933 domain-containing protein [unclassified Caulobacter]|jgi:hypothetical protein|uniref:DUF2933 domain-containing protein n=1 Tax=unclassified Caulobacter TaxID=2648921 RepID=UPI000784FC71|nr:MULTISPECIES: DUF2933 domain-containing protein [unclassified Caulobacter]MBQ1563571.1 DUF2933 domain-containing protein [Caulobacter sp.]PIB96216.1 DUF2933 domain-containing protein [Caulobacter sp. X]
MPLNLTNRALALAALSSGLVLSFFVLREHWAHALGLAPYLLLLACPLMHLFHHGHGGHRHGRDGPAQAPPPKPTPEGRVALGDERLEAF